MRWLLFLLLLVPSSLRSAAQSKAAVDPLKPLDFLLGSWQAKTTSAGSAGATVVGTYSFHRDLASHALQRTSSQDSCKGPQNFDCQHGDQLTVYADANNPHGVGLYALYLDSEGHVIHYAVTTPDAHTVVFSSQGPPNAPQFQLRYELIGSGATAVMKGSFAGAAPGSGEYHPYLEWSGTRQ